MGDVSLDMISVALRLCGWVIAIQCAVIALGCLSLGIGTRHLSNLKWALIGAFLIGCATLVGVLTGYFWFQFRRELFISLPRQNTSADPVASALALLAIQTGIVGYFGIQSPWRYAALVITSVGVVFLLRPLFSFH